MLFVAHSLKELDFRRLMEIYLEGNRENGAFFHPEAPKGQQQLLAEQEFYRYLRESFFQTPGAVCCVWQEEGRYLSALRLEPYRDGMLLEALETAPDCRGKGYATTLIREALALRQEKIYSHISRKNAASIRVHEKCGFRKILDHAVYIDGSVSANADTYCRE